MSEEVLMFGHHLDCTAYTLYAVLRDMLESYFTCEAVKIDTIVCRCVSVRRQSVVCAACVIACAFTRILTKEYTSGINYLISKFFVIRR